MPSNDFIAANRRNWDERVAIRRADRMRNLGGLPPAPPVPALRRSLANRELVATPQA